MISLPGLFVEESESESGESVSSDTPGVRRNTTGSPSVSEAGQEISASGCTAGKMRRARLMKTLHNLHRLAWTRQQTDSAQVLEASPELAAADLTSRTDAVTVHYSRTRWNHVASTVPPLSYKVRSQRFLHCLSRLSLITAAQNAACSGAEQKVGHNWDDLTAKLSCVFTSRGRVHSIAHIAAADFQARWFLHKVASNR